MKPYISTTISPISSGSSIRTAGISASSAIYAVKAPGSVRIGSLGATGGNSGGDSSWDSKGSKTSGGGSHERLRPNRRLDAAAQADKRAVQAGYACPGRDGHVPAHGHAFKRKGRALRKPSLDPF